MNKNRGFASLVLILVAVGIVIIGGAIYFFSDKVPPPSSESVASSTNSSTAIDTSGDGTTVNFDGKVYAIAALSAPCDPLGDLTICDSKLIATDGAGNTTVLVPSFWSAIPQVSHLEAIGGEAGDVGILFADKNGIYLVAGEHNSKGCPYILGYYRFDFSTSKIEKVLDGVGDNNISPDKRYVGQGYTDASSSSLGEDIKIFSLADNKFVYEQKLGPGRSANAGDEGEWCSDLNWNNTTTLTYGIYDWRSAGPAAGPLFIETKTVNVATL